MINCNINFSFVAFQSVLDWTSFDFWPQTILKSTRGQIFGKVLTTTVLTRLRESVKCLNRVSMTWLMFHKIYFVCLLSLPKHMDSSWEWTFPPCFFCTHLNWEKKRLLNPCCQLTKFPWKTEQNAISALHIYIFPEKNRRQRGNTVQSVSIHLSASS